GGAQAARLPGLRVLDHLGLPDVFHQEEGLGRGSLISEGDAKRESPLEGGFFVVSFGAVIPGWSDLSAVAQRGKAEGPDPESRDSLVRNCAPWLDAADRRGMTNSHCVPRASQTK